MTADSASAPSGLDVAELRHLLDRVQDGVVARRQLTELGALEHEIARLLRRKELAVVHPGIYINHTGPLTPEQRDWVAVLACWPAALTHLSACPGQRRGASVHVAIEHGRKVRPPPGVEVHRISGFGTRVDWLKCPPRVKPEQAALDVALSHTSVASRFRVLADACQTRETTPEQIADALAARPRIPGRALLADLLDDLRTGACSVLERGYLHLERTHGLPSADRQQPDTAGGGRIYRDAPYASFGVAIELDGRPYHDHAAARDRDAERDLDTVVANDTLTVRLTHGQVFDRGCQTIRKVATLLERRGWPGRFVCCPGCPRQ